MAKLFFFGDSITLGAWDTGGGWANRLIRTVMGRVIDDNGFYCEPHNLGVSGDTVAGLLKRLDNEIAVRRDPYNKSETIQIVFAIGNNDAQYLKDKSRPIFTSEAFEENLRQLIALAQKYTSNISFIGLLPVDEARVNPVPWAPAIAYTNEHIRRIDDIIHNVCAELGLAYLPLYEKWIALPDYSSLLIDGDHPNSDGHALMAQQISDFLLTPNFFAFHRD